MHFGEFGVPDFAADFVAAGVKFSAHTVAAKFVDDGLRVAGLLIANGEHTDLLWRKPKRKIPGKMLDENADEPLEAAERRAVNHHRTMTLVVGADVFELEPLRKI